MLTSKIRISPSVPVGYKLNSDNSLVDVRPINKDGSLKVLPIDLFPSQPFMHNEEGWIMNDIAAYERAQNDSLARAILQRCPVLADSSRDDGLTVDERLKEIIPANASSPSEFVAVSKHIASVRYSRQVAKEKEIAARVVKQRQAAEKNPKIDDIQPDKD